MKPLSSATAADAMMKPLTYSLLALGLLAAIVMVLWQGAAIIGATMALVGWWFVGICAWYLVPVLGMAWSWAFLFPPLGRPGRWLRLSQLAYINYVGTAINALLPVAAVGGELVKAVMVASRGVPGAVAGASVVADKAAQMVAQLAIGLIGLVALAYLHPESRFLNGLIGVTVFFCALLGVFFWAQTRGAASHIARKLETMIAGRLWWDIVGNAEQLDVMLKAIYLRHLHVAAACGLRLLVRVSFVVETWFIAQLMGYPIGWIEALMIESLTQTIRGMAFVVPSGIGAQEAGFLLLASAAGLPPEVALALSLVKRGREICCSIPALLALQFRTGVRAAAAKRQNGGAAETPEHSANDAADFESGQAQRARSM